MKLSKTGEVGQMRRRRGISMKIMMKEQTLKQVLAWELEIGRMEIWGDRGTRKEMGDVQTYRAEEDDDRLGEMEEVGNAEREAEQYAEHASPECKVSSAYS
jgi:hypothetical protein